MAKKPAAKPKSGKRRKKPKAPDRAWAWWVILLVAGSLVGGLVFLARLSEPPPVPVVPPRVETPVTKPPVVRPDPLRALQSEVEAFLASAGFRAAAVQRDLKSAPVRYTVHGAMPEAALIDGLRERLEGVSPEITATVPGYNHLLVSRGDEAVLALFFVPPLQPRLKGPKVVIIMDDLGRGVYAAQALLGLAQPVSFSILPGEADARRVAELAHAAGREVMLHVPMEPQGYPAVNPGDDALLVRYAAGEIATRMNQLLDRIPYVTGANNHMGSRFTEDAEGMDVVMQIMRERGLFFVDSVTTGHSVVAEAAGRHGVPTLKRSVFLDNVADVELIAKELQHLAAKARKQGQAIGICHPYPETLEALRRELPKLAAQGINFVNVAELLPRQDH